MHFITKNGKKIPIGLKKPDHLEVIVSGSIAPIPFLSAQVKATWDSDDGRFCDATQKLKELKSRK